MQGGGDFSETLDSAIDSVDTVLQCLTVDSALLGHMPRFLHFHQLDDPEQDVKTKNKTFTK